MCFKTNEDLLEHSESHIDIQDDDFEEGEEGDDDDTDERALNTSNKEDADGNQTLANMVDVDGGDFEVSICSHKQNESIHSLFDSLLSSGGSSAGLVGLDKVYVFFFY